MRFCLKGKKKLILDSVWRRGYLVQREGEMLLDPVLKQRVC